MLGQGRGRYGWIAIVVATLLVAWLMSAGLAAIIIGLIFPGGFLIVP